MVRDCTTLRGPARDTTGVVNKRPSAAKRGYNSRRWYSLRDQTFARDGLRCQAPGCGVSCFHKRQAHCDHIVPKSRGGADVLTNLQTLCESCHSKKTRAEQQGRA